MEQLCHEVTFKNRVQDQAMKCRIVSERLEDFKDHGAKKTSVVAPRGTILQLPPAFARARRIGLQIQNSAVQIFLGREVAEQDRFAHPGRRSDVLGLGSAETPAREAVDSG